MPARCQRDNVEGNGSSEGHFCSCTKTTPKVRFWNKALNRLKIGHPRLSHSLREHLCRRIQVKVLKWRIKRACKIFLQFRNRVKRIRSIEGKGAALSASSNTIVQTPRVVDWRVRGTGPAHARKPLLAILADHPVQHFSPLYKELARNESIGSVVIFANLKGAESYFDEDLKEQLSWGNGILDAFPYVSLATSGSVSLHSIWKGLGTVLADVRPDVLFVYGYSVPISRAGILWGRFHGTPMVMTCDSELLHPRSLLTRAAKAVIIPHVLRQFDRLFTVGDANENYFLRYGASRTKFVRVSFPIDSQLLGEVRIRRAEIRREVRTALNVSNSAFLLLTAGKLTPRKGQRSCHRISESNRKTIREGDVSAHRGERIRAGSAGTTCS